MSTCTPALDHVPNEILCIVANHLQQTDLHRLCRVSKSLYSALNHLVWETVTIHAEDEWKLENLDVSLLLRSYTYCPPQDHIQHVRDVIITAPIHHNVESRCPHGHPGRELCLSLVPFLQHFREGQLRTFSWNLGTCLPFEVAPLFGPCGYFTSKQLNIESLCLITEGRCIWDKDPETPLALQYFKKLQHLSWKGLRANKYAEDLRRVLECNADQLESLELDVVDWYKANDTWMFKEGVKFIWDNEVNGIVVNPMSAANFLAYYILQLQPKGHRLNFPALTALSLSNISFDGAPTESAYGFNSNLLKSLKLHNCRGCKSFLRALVDSANGIRLRLFHLSIDDREPEEDRMTVTTFLEAFEGLEELGLLIKPGMATLFYWLSLTRHKSTLRHFIYHERLERDRDNVFLDHYPVSEEDHRRRIAHEAGYGQYLVKLSLDCLAVCDDLASLRTRLELMGPKSPLTLLHIRVSGVDKDVRDSGSNDDSMSASDSESPRRRLAAGVLLARRQRTSLDRGMAEPVSGLDRFASWAFGPDGPSNLQILAYGDFSYQGRYREDTYLFGRNPSFNSPRALAPFPYNSNGYYSLLQKEERRLVMAQYGGFLEACPVDSLVRLDRENMELA